MLELEQFREDQHCLCALVPGLLLLYFYLEKNGESCILVPSLSEYLVLQFLLVQYTTLIFFIHPLVPACVC